MRRHLKYAMARGFHDELQKLAIVQAVAGPVATALPAIFKAVQSLGPTATSVVKDVATNSIVNAATKAAGPTPPGPNSGQPSV